MKKPVAGASTYYLDGSDLSALKEKALAGDAEAALRVYRHYAIGEGDSISSFPWLQVAAIRDNADAQYTMGYTCAYVSPFKNVPLAKYWLRKASRNGSAKAAALLEELPPDSQEPAGSSSEAPRD